MKINIEKIPDFVVKVVLAGIVIFISTLGALIIKDYIEYGIKSPHEKYFKVECKIFGNNTYLFLTTKSDINEMIFKDLNDRVLKRITSLTKDSEYPIKVEGVILEPIAIEYRVDNETKYSYVLCKKEEQKKESLLRKIIGI